MSDFQAESLRAMLAQVAAGTLRVDDALGRLRTLPFAETEDARVDHHRTLRTGLPETIFAQYKSQAQIETIARELHARQGFALATRVNPEIGVALAARLPDARYHARARSLACGQLPETGRRIAVICAGTSDLPVADEAAFALGAWGHDVVRQTDVGVAGIHRMLVGLEQVDTCDVAIVVAGMEGALPGVLAGLVRVPVIAVPTSVGYGASFGGIAALLSMINACASGLAVVNIDNGFGAAALAHKFALRVNKRLADFSRP